MLISTKYGLGDSIWFIHSAALHCCEIITVQFCTYIVEKQSPSDRVETVVTYVCAISHTDNKSTYNVVVNEDNAFSSKDELINTITERFHKSIAPGAG